MILSSSWHLLASNISFKGNCQGGKGQRAWIPSALGHCPLWWFISRYGHFEVITFSLLGCRCWLWLHISWRDSPLQKNNRWLTWTHGAIHWPMLTTLSIMQQKVTCQKTEGSEDTTATHNFPLQERKQMTKNLIQKHLTRRSLMKAVCHLASATSWFCGRGLCVSGHPTDPEPYSARTYLLLRPPHGLGQARLCAHTQHLRTI